MSSTTSQAPTEPTVNSFTSVTKSRIIHIDRSPETFALIIRHMRGYSIIPEDECQNQDLLNDAHYFGLKKLTRLLKQFVYLNVGGTTFRLRWELFNKDGPHNYFTGALRHLHSPHPTLGESAPIYIQRDPETFKDIIRHLQGYSIHIRDEQHRQQLLSDSQFYLLRKLRDKLNTSITRERHSEILLHIEDIKPSQIEVIGKEVYYKQDIPKLLLLTIQLNDFNICCHRVMNDCTFLLEQDIKLVRDPQWAISNKIEFDKDCAIVIGEKYFDIQQYLSHLSQQNQWERCSIHDQNCDIQWFGIEKAIATVYSAELKMLFIAFQKMQIIGSRIQANMKRDFLSTSY
ncbi:uncharacterized protein EV154DRAFT_550754 [Mucor mucedo]|uniref:uncharacterized protein n=1 Tax=Mucor mucedo TaxID=29922 RepID=UPI00221E8589|nr:uncharacterized protein EV154DRAFT_550754 [Mucor mucedo]KAI7892389.1 hypothetical protein EV154DRAFT_550754 [Mucor mucedo]